METQTTMNKSYGYERLTGTIEADLLPLMQLLHELNVDIHLNGLYLLISRTYVSVGTKNLTKYEYSWSDRTS